MLPKEDIIKLIINLSFQSSYSFWLHPLILIRFFSTWWFLSPWGGTTVKSVNLLQIKDVRISLVSLNLCFSYSRCGKISHRHNIHTNKCRHDVYTQTHKKYGIDALLNKERKKVQTTLEKNILFHHNMHINIM